MRAILTLDDRVDIYAKTDIFQVSILNVLITDNGYSHTQKKINDFFV